MATVEHEPDLVQRLKDKRADRLRKGQMTCEIHPIPSNPEERLALVPLLEGEYDECIRASAALDVPENVAGAGVMDRHERREVICHAARNPSDLSKRVFKDVNSMMAALEPEDVNFFYDVYIEMSQTISPQIDTLSEEEIDFLSRLFETMQWKDLSGRQAYALSRFLSTLRPEQLMGRSLGRLLTP